MLLTSSGLQKRLYQTALLEKQGDCAICMTCAPGGFALTCLVRMQHSAQYSVINLHANFVCSPNSTIVAVACISVTLEGVCC